MYSCLMSNKSWGGEIMIMFALKAFSFYLWYLFSPFILKYKQIWNIDAYNDFTNFQDNQMIAKYSLFEQI
jgi:hypothetical protein